MARMNVEDRRLRQRDSIGARSPVYRSAAGREVVLAAYRAQAASIHFGVESDFVPTSFGTTHVVWAGPVDAPPIVVICGVNFGAFFTVEWLESLVPHFRLIIPDIVGQPNLSAETRPKPSGHAIRSVVAREVLEQLDVGPVPMLGFSFGGAVVLDLASIFSLASEQSGPRRARWLRRWRFPERPVALVPAVEPLPVQTRSTPASRNSSAPWGTISRHIGTPFSIYCFGMSDGPSCRRDLSARINLPTFAAPTLAVFAQDDCFFPGEKAAAAARKALGSTVCTRLINGKHIPAATEIAAMQAELRAFFGS